MKRPGPPTGARLAVVFDQASALDILIRPLPIPMERYGRADCPPPSRRTAAAGSPPKPLLPTRLHQSGVRPEELRGDPVFRAGSRLYRARHPNDVAADGLRLLATTRGSSA